MKGYEQYKLLMQEFCKFLGVPTTFLDENYILAINVDGQYEINILYHRQKDSVLLISYLDLDISHSKNPDRLYLKLLNANFGCAATKRSAIGIPPDTSMLSLTIEEPISNMHVGKLDELMTLLSEDSILWQNKLAIECEEDPLITIAEENTNIGLQVAMHELDSYAIRT